VLHLLVGYLVDLGAEFHVAHTFRFGEAGEVLGAEGAVVGVVGWLGGRGVGVGGFGLVFKV